MSPSSHHAPYHSPTVEDTPSEFEHGTRAPTSRRHAELPTTAKKHTAHASSDSGYSSKTEATRTSSSKPSPQPSAPSRTRSDNAESSKHRDLASKKRTLSLRIKPPPESAKMFTPTQVFQGPAYPQSAYPQPQNAQQPYAMHPAMGYPPPSQQLALRGPAPSLHTGLPYRSQPQVHPQYTNPSPRTPMSPTSPVGMPHQGYSPYNNFSSTPLTTQVDPNAPPVPPGTKLVRNFWTHKHSGQSVGGHEWCVEPLNEHDRWTWGNLDFDKYDYFYLPREITGGVWMCRRKARISPRDRPRLKDRERPSPVKSRSHRQSFRAERPRERARAQSESDFSSSGEEAEEEEDFDHRRVEAEQYQESVTRAAPRRAESSTLVSRTTDGLSPTSPTRSRDESRGSAVSSVAGSSKTHLRSSANIVVVHEGREMTIPARDGLAELIVGGQRREGRYRDGGSLLSTGSEQRPRTGRRPSFATTASSSKRPDKKRADGTTAN